MSGRNSRKAKRREASVSSGPEKKTGWTTISEASAADSESTRVAIPGITVPDAVTMSLVDPPRERSSTIQDVDELPGRPTKRPRLEGPPSILEKLNRKRHRDFWYPDGSVVIEVENILFRLHRSKLEKESPLLSCLFAERDLELEDSERMDTKSSVVDFVERCPVISINSTGIKATDFAEVIRAMDEAFPYGFETPPFQILASILQACSILGFEKAAAFARRSISNLWSPDLESLSSTKLPNAIKAVHLAKTCNLPVIRKRALYELLRTSSFGLELDDVEGFEDPEVFEVRSPIRGEDISRLLRAREMLQRNWIEATANPANVIFSPRNCALKDNTTDETIPKARQSCLPLSARYNHWETTVIQSGILLDGLLDPLEGLKRLGQLDWLQGGYCMMCASAKQDMWGRKREAFWNRLDSILALTDGSEEEESLI